MLKLLGLLTAGIALRYAFKFVFSKGIFDVKQNLMEGGLAFLTAIPISALVACSLSYWWVAGFSLLALGFVSMKYMEALNRKKG